MGATVTCRHCGTVIEVTITEGTEVWKCGCLAISVRMDGPVARVNEFVPNASVITDSTNSKNL